MKKILIILLAVLSVLCVFTSCEDGGTKAAEKTAEKTEKEEKTPVCYTVTFKTGIETTVEAQKIESGKKATAPDTSSFTKEGYEFEGWLLDGDDYDFNSPVTKDIVLVAKWAMKCTVVFLDIDGETAICDVQIIDYRDKATKPADPVKAGYTFVRWIERDRSEYNFERPVWNTYLELFAVWEANEYTVTYDANGASVFTSVPSSDKYTYGDSFKASGITASGFSKVGCIFKGWALTKDGDVAYKPGDEVVGEPNNMTLYAVWKDPEYSIRSTGPTGGTIIAVNEDTSSNATWKYIEAAPAVLGTYCFGYRRDVPERDLPDPTNQIVGTTSTAIGAGKTNTEKLVREMGEEAPVYAESETVPVQTSGGEGTEAEKCDTKGIYAARACMDYSLENDGNTYDDWYLPSSGELLDKNTAYPRNIRTGLYITSTEVDADNCNLIFYVEQHTDTTGTIQIPEWMELQRKEKSYTGYVLPVRYI